MAHHAVDERHALAQTLRRTDPFAATLSGEWNAAQLLAHLVLRERSIVDAGRFVPVPALARRADRAVADLAADTPYEQLIDVFDRGPTWREVHGPVPTAWLWSLPAVREQANVIEYLVHHEDVRRAEPDWQPRLLPVDLQRTLWQRLHVLSRVTLRRLPLGVHLQWPAHGQLASRLARRGAPVVTITGDPVELTLFALGRGAVADVQFDGAPADVAIVREGQISF
ncbi:TIGR03085 family metal-binding protein [uncultured Jatrophihabitans sp.]|uniref:TIGR03085 family metal-binding protein n=1 Tax=uncultured Jatrophihabitans sp. TaxID=1610747 RepID=UPI0035CA8579